MRNWSNIVRMDGNFIPSKPLTIFITNVIWTDEACNILYETAGIGICNFGSPSVKFVHIL